MSSVLAVLPVVWRPTAEPCIQSMMHEESSLGLHASEILIVDNTRHAEVPTWDVAPGAMQYHRDPDGHNLGVAGSWNVGAERVIEHELDWLLIVSSSMRFGPALHTTFREQIERHPDAQMVECEGNSWHLIAIARRTLLRVGLFDPNYYPAYEESIDWGYRQKLLGLEDLGWPRVWCNAMSTGHAEHVNRSVWDAPSAPNRPLVEYYAEKWGGPKGEERWDHPFNDLTKPLDWWPQHTIPELAKMYDLEVWW